MLPEEIETTGIHPDGFAGTSGEFPRKEYENKSSINRAARGVNNYYLDTGGAPDGVQVEIPEVMGSHYPRVQVRETAGGHVVLTDDTPGAERYLIMHSSGAGIEFKPDGSIVLVSKNHKIEITKGDQNLVVEGNGTMIYKGNLDLKVTGDHNVSVDGNYSLNVKGSKLEKVGMASREFVDGSLTSIIKGSRNSTTVGANVSTNLAGHSLITKGKSRMVSEGDMIIASSGILSTTSEGEMVITSPNMNIAAANMTLAGDEGTIGGQNVQFYGFNGRFEKTLYAETMEASKTVYSETITASDAVRAKVVLATDNIDAPTFNGDLDGLAKEAITAGTSLHQSYNDGVYVTSSGVGVSPGSYTAGLGSDPGWSIVNNDTGGLAVEPVDTTESAKPTAANMESYLNKSSKGTKKVKVDVGDNLKNMIDRGFDNGDITDRTLTPKQVASKMKNTDATGSSEFINTQITEGKLNPGYVNVNPTSVSNVGAPAGVRGITPIGGSSVAALYDSEPATRKEFIPDQYDPTGNNITLSLPLGPGVTVGQFFAGNDPASLDTFTREEKNNIARHLYLQAQFHNLGERFEGWRLTVEEGVYRKDPNETIGSGSLAESSLEGRTIVYSLRDRTGSIDPYKTFKLAQYWRSFNHYESIILDYNTYDPTGNMVARIILTMPTLSEEFTGSFSRNATTQFNGQTTANDLIDLLAEPGQGTGAPVIKGETSGMPDQNIIDAISIAAAQLGSGYSVQITPNGGRAPRSSGTQNHPPGHAADHYLVLGGERLFPNTHPSLYNQYVSILKANAIERNVVVGIGGYPTFIHYDESEWRRPDIQIVHTWNKGFSVA